MATPHNVQNYAIGKGILYIGEWSGNTPPTDPSGYTDVGNATSIEVEPTLERLPHYSSRSGFRQKDKNPVIQTEYAVRFDLDEPAAVNLNKFLMGTKAGNVVKALTQTDKEYALKFISDNPIGPNQIWRFWKMTLSPNGPFQLIGEEYMVMSFAGDGLSDSANNADSPYITVTYVTTTTTTTTTTT